MNRYDVDTDDDMTDHESTELSQIDRTDWMTN